MKTEAEKKIDAMSLDDIYNTTPQTLWSLTDQYSESLVRILMSKACTITQQKELLTFMKDYYGVYKKKNDPLWSPSGILGSGYPEIFTVIENNNKIGRLIIGDRSVHENEYAKFLQAGSIPENLDQRIEQIVDQRIDNSFDVLSPEEAKKLVANAIAKAESERPEAYYDEKGETIYLDGDPSHTKLPKGDNNSGDTEAIASLKNDLQAFQTREKKGRYNTLFTVKQMAIFLKAILLEHNSLTNNAKNLAPLLQRFGGWASSSAETALGYEVTQEECDELAEAFKDFAPAIGSIIKNFPAKFQKVKGKKLKNNLNSNR